LVKNKDFYKNFGKKTEKWHDSFIGHHAILRRWYPDNMGRYYHGCGISPKTGRLATLSDA